MKTRKSILISFQTVACAFVLAAWLLGDVSWLGMTLAVCFAVGLLSILGNRDNLLFFARTMFIVWIGFVPAFALYLGGYFAWRMPFVQTLDVAFVMTIITTLALFSSQLGIEAGKKVQVRARGVDLHGNERMLFLFISFLFVLVGTLIAMTRGDLIIFSGYVSEAQQASRVQMPFQNLQSIAIILALFAYVLLRRMERYGKLSAMSNQRLQFMFWLCVLYVAVWCQFLRGARMDPLTLLFGLSVLLMLFKSNHVRLNTKALIYLLLAFFVMQVWGGVRHNLQNVELSHINDIAQELYKGSERDGVSIFFRQGTMNNLSLSVATVIYAIDRGEIGYRYGTTYVDYIARTPPAIVYPGRPKSLAWLSDDLYGGGGAGGGFNEMAESYLNFGVFGSLIIPGIISFILSYSFRQFMVNRYNLFRSLVFLSMLAVFFRGTLYQSFAFYKVFVTAVIIYGVVLFVHQLVLKPAKRINSMPRHTPALEVTNADNR